MVLHLKIIVSVALYTRKAHSGSRSTIAATVLSERKLDAA
jgi:hypothetical protein